MDNINKDDAYRCRLILRDVSTELEHIVLQNQTAPHGAVRSRRPAFQWPGCHAPAHAVSNNVRAAYRSRISTMAAIKRLAPAEVQRMTENRRRFNCRRDRC